MANAFLTLNLVLEEGLRGLGDTAAIFKAELVGLVATALSLGVCLPVFGIMGAAASSVGGYVVVAMTLGLSLRRHDLSLAATFRPRLADLRYVITVGTTWYAVRRGASDAIA
jgi:O-antigen/teichoic acid export membrane protein